MDGWGTGLSLDQLKLIQAAFNAGVLPKGDPKALQILGSREYGASRAALHLARELGLDRALYSRPEPWVSQERHCGKKPAREEEVALIGRYIYRPLEFGSFSLCDSVKYGGSEIEAGFFGLLVWGAWSAEGVKTLRAQCLRPQIKS